ncbi:MAG: hypothetical protein JJE25_15340, partial [Bacteroidia bacterium]|nr:hypothetical protein [Bacteroidia bacterium]
RYGIGDIPFEGFAKNIGMGGIGIAYRPPYNVNPINPAAYSAITLTTFEIGASASFTRLTTTSLQQKKSDATFSYFALGFPVVKNKWGAALGLVPFSDVGYKINEAIADTNAGGINNSYEGSGGVNRFFIGNSVSLFKNFSAGVNASYLFGTLKRTSRIEFSNVNFFNSRYTETASIKSVYFSYGMQYVIDSLPKRVKSDSTAFTKVKTDRSLSFGFTFSLPTNLSAEKNLLGENYVSSGVLTYVRDTIINTEGAKGTIDLPYSVGFGFVFKKGNQLLIGADASMQNWKNFSYFGEDDLLRNSLHISSGAQFTPDERAMKSWWQSVQYRFGMFYNQTYLQLKTSQLDEYGLTLGMGLPLRKGLSTIQLSAQLGRRGTTENNLIREDFVRFTLGITFNDRWFIKPKFD